jgi:uncharacterized protein (TIGR01777 family)
MANKTIGITGGTGFVGQHIAGQLTAGGHSVIIFSRSPRPPKGGIRYAAWNPDAKEIDKAALKDVDAIIHLAGASVVEKRWTEKRKDEIRRSRVDATYFLHEALKAHAPNCAAFVAASATGYYGPDRDGLIPFKEDAPPYTDFLAEVCAAWEAATFSAPDAYRTVAMRTGIVLGPDGGAWPQLSQPLSFGIMPILGSGKQVVSWIHIDDLATLYIDAVLSDQYTGVYNAVAPNPVTHRALMKAIARARGGIGIPAPVPAFMLQLIMGDASVEVLKSCTVSAEKAIGRGFHFQYPLIDAAARNIAKHDKS